MNFIGLVLALVVGGVLLFYLGSLFIFLLGFFVDVLLIPLVGLSVLIWIFGVFKNK